VVVISGGFVPATLCAAAWWGPDDDQYGYDDGTSGATGDVPAYGRAVVLVASGRQLDADSGHPPWDGVERKRPAG